MLRDWADKDADAFHRFLWSHHLVYARWYEEQNEFGSENLRLIRRMLFQDLKEYLIKNDMDLFRNVKSVFEVGCSSGFLLRFMETDFFPNATKLEGNDIDGPAIERGRRYLREHASKVRLIRGDMADLNHIMNGSKYDVILCAGVLIYLREPAATSVTQAMLNHCDGLVIISAIAHPTVDNSELKTSGTRNLDGRLIHNIDAIVNNAGGKVVYRRWDGSKTYDGQTAYFIFCKPNCGSTL
jgi:SAM-dependent methyltransferase